MVPDGDLSSLCWEVSVKSGEVEGILTTMRKESPGLIIQLFGASDAPNPKAIEMVAAQTLAAAKSGSTLAERPELDLLLRLAGTRQIGEALRRAGYSSGGKRLFLVAASAGEGAALKRMQRRLAKDRRFAQIPERRLEKEDLDRVERAALLASRL